MSKNTMSGEKPDLDLYRQRALQRHIPLLSSATQSFLYELVHMLRPLQVLEVGTAVGYSSCVMADRLARRQGRLTSFEISAPSYHAALQRKDRFQVRNSTLYHLDILQADLAALGVYSLDFVFIDGMKIQYAAYLHTIRPYCASGCTIVLDDVISQQDKMDALWEYLEKEHLPYEIKKLEDGDGVAIVRV